MLEFAKDPKFWEKVRTSDDYKRLRDDLKMEYDKHFNDPPRPRSAREIFENNDVRSVTVVRMTVPCCGGLPFAVKTALENAGKDIPISVITVTPDGNIIR